MSRPTLYIAVDPGVVSGVTTWSTSKTGTFDPDKPVNMNHRSFEIDDIARTAEHVRDLIDDHGADGIDFVTEMFTISQRTIRGKVFYESLYFNGWAFIEYPFVYFQTPAQAKSFATDDKLKHLGWWDPSKDGHANDAYRHMLVRAVKNREPEVLAALQEMT